MARPGRSYDIYSRKKLPRNRWGLLNEGGDGSGGGGGSLFSGGSGGTTISFYDTPVGDVMATLTEFVGATKTEDGVKGLVPAPMAGMNQYFLQGSGSWVDIPAYRWLKEFPEGDGFVKSGLTIDGDFNVTKTLTTMNLRVEGQAHFFELVIDKIRANGGQVMVSPSLFMVDYVGEIVTYDLINVTNTNVQTMFKSRPDIYNAVRTNNISQMRARRLYMRCDDGQRRTKNEVEPGDMMRCKTFNIDDVGVYHDISNTDYWSFVMDVGTDTYFDDDGIERDAFWIDMVYSMKTKSGQIIPIGTLLHMDGNAPDIPDTYSEVSDILELKKVSNQVLTGNYTGEEEELDGQELIDVQNRIIQIRGIGDNINLMAGRNSSDSVTVNNLPQINRQLAFIAGESDDILDTAGDNNIASLILTGEYDNEATPVIDRAATRKVVPISNVILNGEDGSPARANLIIDRSDQVDIPLPGGTITDRDFVIKEPFITDITFTDPNDGTTFRPGDIVPIDTTIPADYIVPVDPYPYDPQPLNPNRPIVVIDTPITDVVTEEPVTPDPEQPSGTVPSNIDEINTQTDNTGSGIDRDFDTATPDYNSATEWMFGYGIFDCHKDDNLACMGHLWDTDRQNAILLSSVVSLDPEIQAPAICQYNGIDRFGESISNFRITAIASNGNEFAGSFLIKNGNKYIDVNDRINMYITDIQNGLEKVGIHLDGDNSTIRMVGSIDLKQHSSSSYDTLNVYDNLNVKRVEITPQKIPSRTQTESTISTADTNRFNTVTSTKNATSDYISHSTKWIWHGFNSYTEHRYELKNYSISHTVSADLGYIDMNSKLDLRKLNLTFSAKTYLCGSQLVEDHGKSGEQTISSILFTLKRNGTPVQPYDRWDVKRNCPSLAINGLDTDTVTINVSGALLDDWNVFGSGTYTAEITVNLMCYAWGTSKTKYSNPYYKINTSLGGSIESLIEKPTVTGTDNMGNAKMTIGNNGLVFAGNNSRYFYTATDGFEMKWDNYEFQMDSTHGIRRSGSFRTLYSGTQLLVSDDVIRAEYSSGGYTLILPSASEYGTGRQILIVGFAGLKVSRKGNDTLNIVKSNTIDSSYSTLTLGSDFPKYSITLVATPGAWYIDSYL